MQRVHELQEKLSLCSPGRRGSKHAPVNKLVRRAGYRRPVLLGKLAGRIKNPVRPHRLRDDGRKPKGDSPTATQGEKAIIVSTCTTPYPFNILFNQTRGTVKALKEILKWSGFKIIATVERGGTKKSPLQEKDFRHCRKIALKALK